MKRFSFFRAPASSTVPYKDITLVDVYRYIVGDYAKARTEEYRNLLHRVPVTLCSSQGSQEKNACATYKRTKFDYVCFSGMFSKRRDDMLVEHSGYLCVDFDHIKPLSRLSEAPFPQNAAKLLRAREVSPVDHVKNILLSDPCFETMLLFVSPSGDGLKWVIEIDLTRGSHLTWFMGVSRYLKETYGLEADPQCKNVSRACFLPYDKECYIAPRLLKPLSRPDGHPLPQEGKGIIPESMWNENLVDLMEKLGAVEIETKAMQSPNKEQNDNERI